MFPVGNLGNNLVGKRWRRMEILILSLLGILSGIVIFFFFIGKLKDFGIILLIIPLAFVLAGIEGIYSLLKKRK
ncbi:MAG: hypothetical protein AABX84_01045 [Nanoarchaeota archaeon]